MDIQKLFDSMNEVSRRTRSEYHLTLGAAIKVAETATGVVRFHDEGGPGEEMSYRGYYSDLSFEYSEPKPAAAFLAQCRKALGTTYEGYKGGDFVMKEDTPLWRATYGATGDAIISATIEGGDLVLHCKQIGE